MGELLEFLSQNDENFRGKRVEGLYSDFHAHGPRSSNPEGYAANVLAWRIALARIARAGLAPSPRAASSSASATPSLLVVSADENLLQALGRPPALATVVREAVLARELIPLAHFLRARESIYYKSWAALPWNAAAWGLRQLWLAAGGGGGAGAGGASSSSNGSSSSSDERMPGGRFVVVANVEAAARAFGEAVALADSRAAHTWTAAHFKRGLAAVLLPGQRLSDTDMDVLLKFLSRDKGLVLYDGHTVRVKGPGEEDLAAITVEDRAVAQVKELRQYLSHQTDILGLRVQELDAAAKEAVAKKNRPAALAALRSKKLAEASLEKRFASLAQLDDVAAKLEQAADNVQMVKVMAASADALRELNARVGGPESAGDVADRLRHQMAAADEVASILADAAAPVDEAEIDDELLALEARERRDHEEAARRAAEADESVERERRAALLQSEADETARRLAAIGNVSEHASETVDEARAGDATRSMRKVSLEDKPLAEPAK